MKLRNLRRPALRIENSVGYLTSHLNLFRKTKETIDHVRCALPELA